MTISYLRGRMGIGLLAAGVLALAAPAAAMAVDYTVNTDADFAPVGTCDPAPGNCTLREAIAAAGLQDRIILPANHYSVTQGELVLQSDFILGAGARTTVIDALNNSRVLRVNAEGVSGISGVTITHGNGTGSISSGTGGGVFVGSGARLALVDSHVLDNTAGGAGGGIGSSGLSLTVVGSTISGNQSGLGGGIAIASGTSSALIRNSTVSGNSALTGRGPSGGGIYASGSLTLENLTIAGNQSVAGGGLYHQSIAGQPSTDVIRNTIIAGNTGGACGGLQATIDAYQGDHDLDDDGSCGFTAASDRPNANPLLGPLTNNGGPTNTRGLSAGSPAIDSGDPATCLPADQRGTARVATCDIGAFEFVPGPPPQPSPQDLPPPVAGKFVNALPKSGTVRIKLPGTRRFRVLSEGEQIPVGTTIDTRKGRVTLVAAADKKGGTATADFYGGIFKLSQTKRAKPVTTLRLVEKLSCPKRGKATTAAKRKKKRKLWGDGKGRFRTRGSYSAATVRGTKWLVQDRCTSTLTRVRRGRVAVRDFVKKKTVIVRAGKKYVARAKR